MGLLSRFENKIEDGMEGVAGMIGSSSLSPVQIIKKAEREMRREKIVGAGKQYAPTLYTVLVSPEDDSKLFKYYPTLAGEAETYLMAKAKDQGYVMDGQPLVRFISDPDLKKGKFEVIAEMVASSIIEQLRDDEMKRYGISAPKPAMKQPIKNIPPVQPRQAGRVKEPTMQPLSNLQQEDDCFEDDYVEESDGFDEAAGAVPAEDPDIGFVEEVYAEPETLEVYLYDEARDRAYNLTGDPQTIGRESSNDIVVPDINISRVHAEIRRDSTGSWIIADLGSTNGLYINDIKVQSARLRDADMITLGTSTLEFQLLG